VFSHEQLTVYQDRQQNGSGAGPPGLR